MLRRKGAAHFEMIFSFIFFMSFVFFLIVILNYDSKSLSNAVVEELRDSFEERTYTNFTSIFLGVVASGITENCFNIGLPNRLFKYGLSNPIVTDLNETRFNSSLDSGRLNIQGSVPGVYRITASQDFDSSSLGPCKFLGPENYSTGNLIEKKVISYNSLNLVKDSYYGGYNSLKDNFNVPAILDFSITFRDFPDSNMETFIPDRGDVIAKEYLVEVLYPNGTIINTLITFKVW